MGRLLAIARATGRRRPLEEMLGADISVAFGVAGDVRGATPGRQVTVLFREGWEAACGELDVKLPWLTRRANFLVEGVETPHEGGRIAIGSVILEVTEETRPCSVMEAAHRGLRAALKPDWRGGVCCRVVAGGIVHPGDAVDILG